MPPDAVARARRQVGLVKALRRIFVSVDMELDNTWTPPYDLQVATSIPQDGLNYGARSGLLQAHMEHAVDIWLRKLMDDKLSDKISRNQVDLTLKEWQGPGE